MYYTTKTSNEANKAKEQKYLNYILTKTTNTNNYTISYPSNIYENYDATLINKTTNSKINIEYKIRYKDYDDTMLEVQKHQSLSQLGNYFFIITDPSNTYIFNMKNIDVNTLIKTKRSCPNQNYEPIQYVMKDVYLLPKSLATKIMNLKNNQL